MNIWKRIANGFARAFTFGRWTPFKDDGDRYGVGVNRAEADADETTAVAKIRASTHPDYQGHFGRLRHEVTPATSISGGWPVIQGGVGGYYIMQDETEVTVHDNGRIVRKVRVHECAHHKEHKLKLIPPWHYPPWRGLFLNWYNVTAQSVPNIRRILRREKRAVLCDSLPFVKRGQTVEADTIEGQFTCRCTKRGLEIVA